MNLDELKATYPSCPDALDWTEEPEMQEAWAEIRELRFTPGEAVRFLRSTAVTGGLAATMAAVRESGEIQRFLRTESNKIVKQIGTADFLRYVTAKLSRA